MNGARMRRLTDAGMTVCLFFLMGFPFFGMTAHMTAGTAFFLLLGLHHWLNRRWVSSLPRGRWNAVRYLQTGANFWLAAVMAALLWSSLILARPVLGNLPIPGSMTLGREMHMAAAYWGFLAISFHIGLHGDRVISRLKKAGSRTRALAAAAGRLLPLYGLWTFWDRNWISYLFLQNEFVFFDPGESRFLFYLDHAAIMALFLRLGREALRLARRRR